MTESSSAPLRIPYPGWNSFAFQDRDFFFGRDEEGSVVAAMIAAEPISILTGASGTGKSSLLRAAIIPSLLSRGWCVVYAHPGADPVAALRSEVLRQALPDPGREVRFIDRLLEISGSNTQSSISGNTSLSDAVKWYGALSPSDPRRSALDTSEDERIPLLPLLTYALSGYLTPAYVAQSLSRLAEVADQGVGTLDLGLDPMLDALKEMIPRATTGHRLLTHRLEGPATAELADLAMDVWCDWLRPLRANGLALVLDQAEELYTTYGYEPVGQLGRYSPGSLQSATRATSARRAMHSPEARDHLFSGISALFEAATHFPIRICLSLRPEWYTELRVSLGEFAPNESRALYILRPLSKAQAASAISEPLTKVNAGITGDALEELLEGLQSETGVDTIDPFLLGIAARAAWDFAVQDPIRPEGILIRLPHIQLIKRGPRQIGNNMRPTEVEGFGIGDGTLLWKLQDQFGNQDIGAQFAPLEMLSALFTSSGTRRVLPAVELIERPLRVNHFFRDVLNGLVEAGLVRQFRIGRDDVVEIRHDRLFAPINFYLNELERAAATEQGGRWRSRPLLNRAIDLLLSYDGNNLAWVLRHGIEQNPLPDWAQETLGENEALVAWDPPAARVLLASLLYAGPRQEWDRGLTNQRVRISNRDILSEWENWVLKLIAIASRPVELGIGTTGNVLARGAPLTRSQLTLLLRDPAIITVDSRASVLRSLLMVGDPDGDDEVLREEIQRWTRSTATTPR
jgi:hypothetical protein